ncbi:hypothetical protein GK047_20725 [Paenibacillus sp. SYP-B3998]|uniref:Fibronectin type III domain-containing protein n=1 Tax=Paenibacillus sp. SYP-B3998 TaxID=2678564 RepID=A0A6G4A1R1_9BACL|nr:fibronectin type III domain-containing protein [Paenibacillus sp. SYP-B3998]NEW08426.1 hypothetical protein [Paenibacillus sp. SYP-B3998]
MKKIIQLLFSTLFLTLLFIQSVAFAEEVNLTPAMTSNTSPSGTVSASSVYYASDYAAWYAFDKRTGAPAPWIAKEATGWIRYDFGSSKSIVTRYEVTSKDHEAYTSQSPKSWVLEGSDNGISWDVLDTQTNVSNWARREKRSFKIPNITDYKMYQVRVTQTFGGVVSVEEIGLYGGIAAAAPSTPTNLKATAGDSSVKLNWTANTEINIGGYNIYVDGIKLNTTPIATNSFNVTGLINGRGYGFQVSAVDKKGAESIKSVIVDGTPVSPLPANPSGLTAIAGDREVSLLWNMVSGATGYNIKRSTTVGGPYTTVANNVYTSLPYKDTALTNGTTYYYVVSAVNTGGESGNSNEVSATPVVPIPANPSGLVATAGDAEVSLSWNMVPAATGYNIKRSTTVGGPYTTVANNVYTSLSYTDTALTNGTTYYYVVSAVNAGGESGNSNEASATPQSPITSLNVIIAEEKVKIGQEFTSNIALKNAKDIYAEDFTMKYDNKLFDYVGVEEVPGYKIYNKPTDQNGELRFIVASQGKNFGITGEKTFLKLKFKAKAAGTGKVDALKCRIADTQKEFDLVEGACSEDTVTVEGVKDVNRTGEYTLLDLSIDAYYFGELASNADPSKYDANQAGDEYVKDEDLVFIANQMINNANYTPNN